MSDARDAPSDGLFTLAAVNFTMAAITVASLLALMGTEADAKSAFDFPTFSVILSWIAVGLLVASGIGYLRGDLLLGRWGGTAYAAVAILACFVLAGHEGHSLRAVGLVYPLLTLTLLHGPFRARFSS